jgi:hypothetical protein
VNDGTAGELAAKQGHDQCITTSPDIREQSYLKRQIQPAGKRGGVNIRTFQALGAKV